MDNELLKKIIEGALLAAGRSLDIGHLQGLFDLDQVPAKDQLLAVLEDIENDCAGRGYELQKTGSGYRFQVRQELAPWINRLWEEKPKKYSRALLETLALIAYRQPLTRGDIEEIRGVSVSSEIIKTLQEREWVRVVGHRDVPGRPALYATTREFLDYFGLQSLEALPALSDIRDIDSLDPELSLPVAGQQDIDTESEPAVTPENESAAADVEQSLSVTEDEDSGMQQN
ncbi:MAG: SMC-Scp complex subunit ScpB [Gammaproteobacteria bacterium]|nr:MAG: SMC-Scp complex subunit ScpB [Gammaproteobacteria bacterium]